MLIQFSVENYLSIKDKCILSLEPSSDNEHPENIISLNNDRALNTIALYGANASGKSNVFKALTTSILLVRNSNIMPLGVMLPVVPFKFDTETVNKPSAFEYTFVATDNKKYIYGFSATSEKIIDEYLYCYNTAKPSLVFERSNTSKYVFTKALTAKLQPLADRNTDNKLFLATATAWNADITRAAFEWFLGSIETFTSLEGFENMALEMYRKDDSHALLNFTADLLRQADINIDSLDFEAKEVSDSGSSTQPIQLLINGIPAPGIHIQYKVTTGHTIKTENSAKHYELNLNDESDGTRKLFFYGPMINQVLQKGSVLVIDEIDKSLHPFIVKYLIDMFRNPKINKNGAQLIATTHDTSLLSLDTFRRDQIYFTEKDAQSGITDLYSLDEFSVRKTENIEKGYLLGRYGAIPYLHSEEIL